MLLYSRSRPIFILLAKRSLLFQRSGQFVSNKNLPPKAEASEGFVSNKNLPPKAEASEGDLGLSPRRLSFCSNRLNRDVRFVVATFAEGYDTIAECEQSVVATHTHVFTRV